MEVRVGERVYQVGVRAEGGDWVVTIGERTCRVSVARTGHGWSLLIGAVDADEAAVRGSYDVAFERDTRSGLTVHVNGVRMPVTLPEPTGVPRGRRGDSRSGAGEVVAPMPGRVVTVLVEPGDEVVERQAVVVLEAMKMQNEVRAARSGVVTAVRVVSGAAVDAGAVLVTIGDRTAAPAR